MPETNVRIEFDGGDIVVTPEDVELDAVNGDSVRWTFVGRELQILFGQNIAQNLNTPFDWAAQAAGGGNENPDANGAIDGRPLTAANGPEDLEFTYQIVLQTLDGAYHTRAVGPMRIRRRHSL